MSGRRVTPEEAAETERMLLDWLRNKPHAPATEADRKKAARDLLDVGKGPPIELPERGTKTVSAWWKFWREPCFWRGSMRMMRIDPER
jgi:hypothetical protein